MVDTQTEQLLKHIADLEKRLARLEKQEYGSVKATAYDAFGRLRVAEPHPIFDNMSEYGVNSFWWEGSAVGTGAISTVANNCAVRLTTGGTANNAAYDYRTRMYHRYQPGRSLNIEMTFTMSAAKTNVSAFIGYFDASNGIFLKRVASTLSFVRRTNVTGTPTDNAVAQGSWSIDNFDGTGPSGKTLDVTKANIMFIQLQFLGVGQVTVGFVIDGQIYPAHQWNNANNLATVYMSSGCLPLRAYVVNTGLAGGVVTLDLYCVSVSSGGMGAQHLQWSVNNGVTARSTTTTALPLISIRAATLLGGTGGGGSITNRGHIEPIDVSVLVTNQSHLIELYRNTTLTNPSWAAVNTASIADYDVAATAISGGTLLDSFYIPATASQRGFDIQSLATVMPFVYSGLLSVQDILTVAVRTTTGNGTAVGTITWQEEY